MFITKVIVDGGLTGVHYNKVWLNPIYINDGTQIMLI